MIVMNTFYDLPKRLYTRRYPQDCERNLIRNQRTLYSAKYTSRKYMKSVKAYPGADGFSDHNPIRVQMNIKLKRTSKKRETRIIVEHIKEQHLRNKIQTEINKNLKARKSTANA